MGDCIPAIIINVELFSRVQRGAGGSSTKRVLRKQRRVEQVNILGWRHGREVDGRLQVMRFRRRGRAATRSFRCCRRDELAFGLGLCRFQGLLHD